MIKHVRVYNRRYMWGVASGEIALPENVRPWHLVSIHGDNPKFLDASKIKRFSEMGMLAHVSFDFWDVTHDPGMIERLKKHKPNYVLFNQKNAEDIVRFMEDRKREEGDHLLVCQCDGGVSRSGAVGLFACEFFGLDAREFFIRHPQVQPNPMILRMLRNQAGLGGPSAFMTASEAFQEELNAEIKRRIANKEIF